MLNLMLIILRNVFLQFAVFFICFSISCVAQTNVLQLKGQVLDFSNSPVPFASVALLSPLDSSKVKIGSTDKDGKFLIKEILPGKYLLLTSAVGYNNKYSSILELYAGNPQLLDFKLVMTELVHSMGEVTISARKPAIQVKADKIILNVAASINSTGLTVFELLRKAPGVRIIGEDNVMISGKSGLLLYLDGNQIDLKGKDLADFMRSIPSSNIESIEIITNPSAKYDAVGNAGVISIKTKKNTNNGLNGSTSLTGGFSAYKPKYDGALNLNYRTTKINAYANYNYYYSDNKVTSDYFRRQKVNNDYITFDQHYQNLSSSNGHNYKAGIDFFLSPNSTVGVILDGSTDSGNSASASNTKIYGVNSVLDSQLVANNNIKRHNDRNTYTINYAFKDTLGREFSINANYGAFNKNNSSYQPNVYFNPQGIETSKAIYNNLTASNIDILVFKSDYQQKALGGVFGIGAKFSHVRSDNDLKFYNQTTGTSIPDEGRTNQFQYNENISAAYINYNITLKKLSLQFGLRGEYTSPNGVLSSLKDSRIKAVDTSYFKLFPNAVVTYAVNKNNSLGITYNKRIDRPSYQDLNPFEYVMDELSYVKGNPFLRPQLTDNLKLTYIHKQKYVASVSYANTRDYMLNYRDTIANGRTFESPTNLMHLRTISADLIAQFNIGGIWDTYLNLNGLYQEVRGAGKMNVLSQSRTTWSFSTNNSFNLPHNWSVELSGYYNAAFLDVPALVSPQWSIDAGIQKKIMKDAMTLRMSMSDVFNTLDYKLKRDFGGLYYVNRNKWETQQVRLSLSYRFGNKNVKGPANLDNGLKDLKNRIK